AVRYSLLDEVVVLERSSLTWSVRSRSTELTSGRRWQIFWAAILFFIFYLVLSAGVNLPLIFVQSAISAPVAVVLDCVTDIAYAVIQIVLFLFYWESTELERRVGS